ncbi:MAG: Uma2 family endonuclease [Phaeodactylibacter sp.]|nr:Uma2 family endonuclease [Phaeodactylibacter sp.]MCB9053102.1 Uma2 family endonuclease [Lewinellaceae bacterium]
MKAHKLSKLTVEEYIQYEIQTGQKYEYHDGIIYALAGGSLEHALLIGNIYSELRNGLRKKGSNCKPITNDAKLYIEKENKYVYPDTMVICGEIEKTGETKDAVSNPTLIVEVLSKSTSEYDRGDKFYFYRQIPTLQEYVLIDQSRYVVEVFFKKGKNDLWRISRYEGLDQMINLQSLGIEISMKELYFDIKIENANS